MFGILIAIAIFCNGSLVADILGYLRLDLDNTQYAIIMSSVSDVTATLNTFLPSYVWLADSRFRQKLISTCRDFQFAFIPKAIVSVGPIRFI